MTVLAATLIALAAVTGLYIWASWAPELSFEELRERWGRPPSQFVDIAGMRVHMRDEGPRDHANPIVLLHGNALSLHSWDGWAAALTGRHRVIRFDLPGFGLTGPPPDRIYGEERDVQVVTAVLDHLAIERCVLGGNSLGGGIALATALLHPSRVKKLILVDSSGAARPTPKLFCFHYLARLPMSDWMVRNTLARRLVEGILRNLFRDHPAKVTPELVRRVYELTRRQGNRRALIDRERQWQWPSGYFAHRKSELKLPTLIIWGGRDYLTPVEDAKIFYRNVAGSNLVIFDDLGHMPHEEDPARTVRAVEDFLEFSDTPRARA
jgi:pimeloyl-ACP methyl ester carboxylesterase